MLMFALTYKPVQVFILIWWPHRFKKFEPNALNVIIPQTQAQKNRFDPGFQMVLVVCHIGWSFAWQKNGFVSRNDNKVFFCCSEIALSNFRKKISHNLWWNGWILMISGMLGPSALQWLANIFLVVLFLLV